MGCWKTARTWASRTRSTDRGDIAQLAKDGHICGEYTTHCQREVGDHGPVNAGAAGGGQSRQIRSWLGAGRAAR